MFQGVATIWLVKIRKTGKQDRRAFKIKGRLQGLN